MDDKRFDALARLAATASRRGLLKTLAGAVGGGLLALHERRRKAAGRAPLCEELCEGCCEGDVCVAFAAQANDFCGHDGGVCGKCLPGQACYNGRCTRCHRFTCSRGCCDPERGCLPGSNRDRCGYEGRACFSCPDYWRCEEGICTRCDLDCAGGCCDIDGVCVPAAGQSDANCRLADGTCGPCPPGERCVNGICAKQIGLAPLDPDRPDFAFAATRPSDFGGPFAEDDLGVAGGVSYTGLAGGLDSGAINERMHDALDPIADQLVSGHVSIVTLRDDLPVGPAGVPITARTDLLEFAGLGVANDALAQVIEAYFAGTTGIESPGGKGSFVSWRGGSETAPIDNLAAAFRHGATVGVLQIGTPGDAASVADVANAVEDVRKAVVRRLDEIDEPDFAGLNRKLPSLERINEASGDGLPGARGWRSTFYTHAGDRVIPDTAATEELLRDLAARHADVVYGVTRLESVSANGGAGEIRARVDAYQFKDATGAAAYHRAIPERTQEAMEQDPSFQAAPLDVPSVLPSLLDPLWFVNLFTNQSGATTGGVRVWFRLDIYVFGVLLLGAAPVTDGTLTPAAIEQSVDQLQAGINAFALAQELRFDDPGADWFDAWEEWGKRAKTFDCGAETARLGHARLARSRPDGQHIARRHRQAPFLDAGFLTEPDGLNSKPQSKSPRNGSRPSE